MLRLTQDRLKQLKELSSMDLLELKAMKELAIRYYGPSSVDVRLYTLELRRRRKIRPEVKPVVESLRRKAGQIIKEIKRIDGLNFSYNSMLYDRVTLEPYEPKNLLEDPDPLTGRMAYRVAIERVLDLELELQQLENHIHYIQQTGLVNTITLDMLEAYNIRPEAYRIELKSRLATIRKRFIPGTSIPLPPINKCIPIPPEDLGPLPTNLLEVHASNKNFMAGAYPIVCGGIGWNRYYCRQLLELLKPDPGHRLFVASYAAGYGFYIISVPEERCRETALNSRFNRKP